MIRQNDGDTENKDQISPKPQRQQSQGRGHDQLEPTTPTESPTEPKIVVEDSNEQPNEA